MEVTYLYRITNIVTGKSYIGVTKDPKSRWRNHLGLRSGCVKLRNSMNKHGRENFLFKILCVGDEDYIIDLEVKAIEAFDTTRLGYNILKGHPKDGISLDAQIKLKISESLKCFWSSDKSPDCSERKSASMKGKNAGQCNGMFGRSNPSRHRAVSVEGVYYESITDAVKNTKYTKSQIEKRLSKGVDGFSYT